VDQDKFPAVPYVDKPVTSEFRERVSNYRSVVNGRDDGVRKLAYRD